MAALLSTLLGVFLGSSAVALYTLFDSEFQLCRRSLEGSAGHVDRRWSRQGLRPCLDISTYHAKYKIAKKPNKTAGIEENLRSAEKLLTTISGQKLATPGRVYAVIS